MFRPIDRSKHKFDARITNGPFHIRCKQRADIRIAYDHFFGSLVHEHLTYTYCAWYSWASACSAQCRHRKSELWMKNCAERWNCCAVTSNCSNAILSIWAPSPIVIVGNCFHHDFSGRFDGAAGYPGGLKERTAQQVFDKKPEQVLRSAVSGMLPKNLLRKARMRKLRIFPGTEHPFTRVDLVPWEMPPRKLRDKGLGWVIPEGSIPMNPEAYLKRLRTSKYAEKMKNKLRAWGLEDQ